MWGVANEAQLEYLAAFLLVLDTVMESSRSKVESAVEVGRIQNGGTRLTQRERIATWLTE